MVRNTIKLNKLAEPAILTANKKAWTDQYLECLQQNQKTPEALESRYRSASIKEALCEETHKKCAYCESKIKHISYGDVEHILPKSKVPSLVFEWSNLTLSCTICNQTSKHDYYEPNAPLINPYIDDPEEHLIACGPMIWHKLGSSMGKLTELILKLNRSELVEQRVERLKRVMDLADAWEQAQGPLKEALKEQLFEEAASDKEYSFIVKGLLSTLRIA